MDKHYVEVEATSLEEAKRKLQSQLTNGVLVLREFVQCEGDLETVEGIADTIEDAFIKAEGKIPLGSTVERKEIKRTPEEVESHAESMQQLEYEVREELEVSLKPTERIKSVSLKQKGKNGFLGFGKTPHLYEIRILRQAIVAITFRKMVKIRAWVSSLGVSDCAVLKKMFWQESDPTWRGRGPIHMEYLSDECGVHPKNETAS